MAGDLANALLSPKEITLTDQNGKERIFIISKFPAVVGREIMSQYLSTGLPKIGDYGMNQTMMLKLMSYVAVPIKDGAPQRLINRALIDNHAGDWETLGCIEVEMMQYNSSFFLRDKALTFFDAIMGMIVSRATEILTGSLPQSSTQAKPPSTN